MASAWMPGIDGGRGSADGGSGRLVGFGVVLRSPLRGRFMWPLDVAGLGMRYFVMDLMSRCGAPRRKPALIAVMSDNFGRLPRLWCMNVMALAFVVQWYEKVAMSVAAAGDNGARPSQGLGRDGVVLDAGVVHCSAWLIMGSIHRSLVESFVPVMIVLPLKVTQHFSSSKITSHPALYRIRIPSRDAIFISGTMCPTKVCGRPGMTISHVCVDVIRLPSGRLILIGLRATWMLFAGAPAMTKIDVAPVSAMA